MGGSYAASCAMALATGAVAILTEQTATSWVWLLLGACVLKACLSSAFVVTMIYTAEAYPTLTANFGYGVCNAVTRLSAALTPTVSQMLLDDATSLVTFSSYALSCAGAALLCTLLPFETLGRDADAAERAGGPKESSPLNVPKR